MSHLLRYDHITFEGHETYQKRSYRNRIHIADAQGKRSVSIPLVKGKHEQLSIREVNISYDTSWDKGLKRLLKASYGSAPYFDYYYDELVSIIDKRHQLLWNLNYDMLQFIMTHLGFSSEISISPRYTRDYDDTEIQDLRAQFSPTRSVDIQQVYDQVFLDRHGFISDLSSLDLLMCCGPESAIYLAGLKLS